MVPVTLRKMESATRLLEITPPSRAVSRAAKFGIGVILFPQLVLFAVLVVLAVSFPFARFVLGVWVLSYAVVATMLIRTIRRQRRGTVQTPTLWLTADTLGYTNRQGVTVSCRRGDIASALRLLVTVNRQARDLLVFRDAKSNAILTTPLTTWRSEDIERVTEALGIPSAHRRFINSLDEMEAVAHGSLPPRSFALSRKYRWTVILAIYAAAIVFVVILVVTQR